MAQVCNSRLKHNDLDRHFILAKTITKNKFVLREFPLQSSASMASDATLNLFSGLLSEKLSRLIRGLQQEPSPVASAVPLPDAGHHGATMPRKHLDRYSRVKPCISFFSVRNQVPMFCESNTERDLLIDLEFDPTVRAYRTQPATFRYTIRGQQRRYTPDLLILDRDTGFRYEEMKTAAEAETPKFRKKFGYLQHLFRTRLRVPLELRIGRAPEMKQRTANRRWLYGYLQCAIDQVWLQALPPTGTRILYGDAVALLTRTGGSAASVLTLIAHGLLQFDVSSPLGNDTQLEVRNV